VHPDVGKFLGNGFPVIKMIPQMHNGLGLHGMHRPPHKGDPRMGIGQNKNFHRSSTALWAHIVVLAAARQDICRAMENDPAYYIMLIGGRQENEAKFR
jgi:hypothetical protein